jgi:hypothetical protein
VGFRFDLSAPVKGKEYFVYVAAHPRYYEDGLGFLRATASQIGVKIVGFIYRWSLWLEFLSFRTETICELK